MRRHAEASESGRVRTERRRSRHAANRLKRALFRVFIFSEHAIYCDSLRTLFDADSGFRIVGSATEWTLAASAARACRPDIILLDLDTPRMPRSSTVSSLLAACRSARIIVLVPQLEKREVTEALRLGIRGVVLKDVNAQILFKSIRAVGAGQYWIDRELLVGLVQTLSGDGTEHVTGSKRRRFGLTSRELEIVSAVLGGGPNKEIARQSGISEKTVKRHLTNIFAKLGLSNRVELAMFALEHQLVARALGHSDESAPAR